MYSHPIDWVSRVRVGWVGRVRALRGMDAPKCAGIYLHIPFFYLEQNNNSETYVRDSASTNQRCPDSFQVLKKHLFSVLGTNAWTCRCLDGKEKHTRKLKSFCSQTWLRVGTAAHFKENQSWQVKSLISFGKQENIWRKGHITPHILVNFDLRIFIQREKAGRSSLRSKKLPLDFIKHNTWCFAMNTRFLQYDRGRHCADRAFEDATPSVDAHGNYMSVRLAQWTYSRLISRSKALGTMWRLNAAHHHVTYWFKWLKTTMLPSNLTSEEK